jgi:sulfate permease, SulP family
MRMMLQLRWLSTAIIGGACVAAFGASRVQIAGPTGAFVAILAGVTAKYGISGLEAATTRTRS